MKQIQSELVVFGDIAMDIFMEVSSLPEKGEDVRVNNTDSYPGGSASNCATVAANLGVHTRFLGNAGTDFFGSLLIRDIKKAGVNTSHLLKVDGKSGMTTSMLTPDGERTFYSYRGVNSYSNSKHVLLKFFKHAAIFHLTGYSFQDLGSRQTALHLIQTAQSAGVPVSLDPSFNFAQGYSLMDEKILNKVQFFFPNRVEAELLCGTRDPQKAAHAILEMGPQMVIIKLDSQGCLLSDCHGTAFAPGFQISNVLDTTGAGDAFCAGFLSGQIWGLSKLESAVVGNLLAAENVQIIGGHTRAVNRRKLINKLIDFQYNEIARKLLS